ncbi:MAG: hypothetical protein V1750_00865 [Acidobacteriota bacterium]
MRRLALVVLFVLMAALAAGEEFFIPVAAQKEGADGSWWNTEVWLSNTTASTAGYAAIFLPGLSANNLERLQAEPPMEDIAPRATLCRSDLVPQGSSGALRVLTTPGVVVYARVFNAAGRGSSGQGLRALPRSAAVRPGEIAYLVGLRRTPQFRTSVGLLNPNLEGCAVRALLLSQRGETVGEQQYRLGPGAVLVLDEILHSLGVVRGEHMRLELSGTAPFFAYAQVIDTRSGAPTLQLPLR